MGYTVMKLGMWVVMGTSPTHVVCRHQTRILNTSFAYLFWLANNKKKSNISPAHFLTLPKDGTPPNPSTIDVMVGSPSKKQMRVRDMLQSLGNLFLLRLIIYYEFERV